MTITTRIFTSLKGELVGTDSAGNKYYQEKRAAKNRRTKRWVIYPNASLLGDLLGGGMPDPSRVTPDWHGWLHYTTNTPPNKQHRQHYGWEKPAVANMTGTPNATLPSGHLSRGGHHQPTLNTYEPWKP